MKTSCFLRFEFLLGSVVMNIDASPGRKAPAVCLRRRRIVALRNSDGPCFTSGRRRKVWTDRVLMSLPRDGYKYELSNGEIIMSPAGFNHGDICVAISEALRAYVRARKLGTVCDGQTGFRLRRGVQRKTVLCPDVSFVAQARVEAMTDRDKFFEGGPDLAVEVLSPGDSLEKTAAKLRRLFLNGTRLGWIVDPVSRQVQVHREDGEVNTYGLSQTLDGGDCLPGFRLRVRRILE